MNKILILSLSLVIAKDSFGMHIMEGFLPASWAIFWWILALPVLIIGMKKLGKLGKEDIDIKMPLAMIGAFVFVLSALKIPSVTGSSSHPTGVGLGAILFGPTIMSIIGFVVLVLQASFMAHGGFTTLGANTVSMAIIGPVVTFVIYRLLNKNKINSSFAIFIAATLGNIATYSVTSIQLALAHGNGSIVEALIKFLSIFALTQIPIAIIEGIITVLVINHLPTFVLKKRGVING